jgi:cation diffusion facilitator family transporter
MPEEQMTAHSTNSDRSVLEKVARTAQLSILVAVTVMALKYAAYHVTGSVALYSDALESIVNILSAFAALAAVHVSAKPADDNHPFGHAKAEYFSAVFEGVLVILAAVMIMREAYLSFLSPRALEEPALGLAINGVATAVNAAWAIYLVQRGRVWRSPALVADGWHLASDVFTSIGVIAGLVLAAITGYTVLDPLLAAVVAANILWAGYRIIKQSLGGLMDEAVDAISSSKAATGRCRCTTSARAMPAA